jgi:hypothetical protein
MPMTLPFQSMLKFWMWSGQPTGVHMFWMSRHCAQALSNVWCSVDGKAGSLPDDLHGPAPVEGNSCPDGRESRQKVRWRLERVEEIWWNRQISSEAARRKRLISGALEPHALVLKEIEGIGDVLRAA